MPIDTTATPTDPPLPYSPPSSPEPEGPDYECEAFSLLRLKRGRVLNPLYQKVLTHDPDDFSRARQHRPHQPRYRMPLSPQQRIDAYLRRARMLIGAQELHFVHHVLASGYEDFPGAIPEQSRSPLREAMARVFPDLGRAAVLPGDGNTRRPFPIQATDVLLYTFARSFPSLVPDGVQLPNQDLPRGQVCQCVPDPVPQSTVDGHAET